MEEGDFGPMAGTVGAWLVTVASVFGLIGGMITGFRQLPLAGSVPLPSSSVPSYFKLEIRSKFFMMNSSIGNYGN